MLNYLSLLGWNDGSEQEIYSVEELQRAFSLERITKSAAGGRARAQGWEGGRPLGVRSLLLCRPCLHHAAPPRASTCPWPLCSV
jgi:hypothetical protein